MKFNIGDRVKRISIPTENIGTIVDVYKEDLYLRNGEDTVLFASKGEYKVHMDGDSAGTITPCSGGELEKI